MIQIWKESNVCYLIHQELALTLNPFVASYICSLHSCLYWDAVIYTWWPGKLLRPHMIWTAPLHDSCCKNALPGINRRLHIMVLLSWRQELTATKIWYYDNQIYLYIYLIGVVHRTQEHFPRTTVGGIVVVQVIGQYPVENPRPYASYLSPSVKI